MASRSENRPEILLLAQEFDRHAQMIARCDSQYRFLTVRGEDGSPHVEFLDGEFQHVVTERGLELERRRTSDIREILYWLLNDLTFWMAVKWEFTNRVESQDCRRLIFAHQVELMRRASPGMATRLESDIASILDENPYIDR